jgi:hypothetical protein
MTKTNRKEVTTMKYEKPEVTLIGAATATIQMTQKNGRPTDDPSKGTLTAPAYEADE